MIFSKAFFFLFLILINSTEANTFHWGFHGIRLSGTKTEVLELSKSLKTVFATDDGERLINYFKLHQLILKTDNTTFAHNSPHDVFYYLNTFRITRHPDARPLIYQPDKNETISAPWTLYPFITIKGPYLKRERMMTFLKKIDDTVIGHQLFQHMKACSKKLIIFDDKHSLSGGGYTAAIKTSTGIFEGRGEDARIRFRFDQPTQGSHLVQTRRSGPIPFTYIDNIFHELVHAKHIMCGTMSKFKAEHQAIREENRFRKSREETAHLSPRDPNQYENGQQRWFGLFFSDNL